MSFDGTGIFKIKNATGNEIKNVRITHFLSNNEHSEFFIKEKMGSDEEVHDVPFTSHAGKNDNWTVAFQLGEGCYMSKKLDKSMEGDRSDYQLVIGMTGFSFVYNNGKKEAEVNSVYKIL
jgi:hypothetical protein